MAQIPTNRSAHEDVCDDLVAWQATGDDHYLERVIRATLADLQRAATRTLRKLGIRDRSAADDAISLVFDHVRRLAVVTPGERPVVPFDGRRRPQQPRGDPGIAYLMWLTEERAHDVARSRRRLARQTFLFTEVPHACSMRSLQKRAILDESNNADSDLLPELHSAITRLEPRLRTVIELLLEGKSQTVIAHMLDVCEGTVSRLRRKAIEELKRLVLNEGR